MKVKKLLIGLFVSGLAFSFAGCGDEVINEKGERFNHLVSLLKLIKRVLHQMVALHLFNILYMIKPLKSYMYCKV